MSSSLLLWVQGFLHLNSSWFGVFIHHIFGFERTFGTRLAKKLKSTLPCLSTGSFFQASGMFEALPRTKARKASQLLSDKIGARNEEARL